MHRMNNLGVTFARLALVLVVTLALINLSGAGSGGAGQVPPKIAKARVQDQASNAISRPMP